MLNKALHDLVRQTEELYLRYSFAEGYRFYRAAFGIHTYRLALLSVCSSFTSDLRIGTLFTSSFVRLAGRLALIDLCATSITSISIITIFQACPSLRELDVDESVSVSVLDLVRLLEATPRSTLLFKHLQTMEICGSGEGNSWVGYRPQLGSASKIYQFPSSCGYMMDYQRAVPSKSAVLQTSVSRHTAS